LIRFSLVCILAMVALLAGGCASTQGPCHGKSLAQLLDATDLKSLFQQAAYELCTENCRDCIRKSPDGTVVVLPDLCSTDDIKRQTVLVTDFVDIKTYAPEQHGLLMGELMRGSLNQVCCYRIVQAEFGKYFKLNENGLVSLTRRISDVKQDSYPQPEAVIGTYNHVNSNKMVLFVRRINTTTGQVVKMVTREIDYSCNGRQIYYGVR
jgi:hypothetical protein